MHKGMNIHKFCIKKFAKNTKKFTKTQNTSIEAQRARVNCSAQVHPPSAQTVQPNFLNQAWPYQPKIPRESAQHRPKHTQPKFWTSLIKSRREGPNSKPNRRAQQGRSWPTYKSTQCEVCNNLSRHPTLSLEVSVCGNYLTASSSSSIIIPPHPARWKRDNRKRERDETFHEELYLNWARRWRKLTQISGGDEFFIQVLVKYWDHKPPISHYFKALFGVIFQGHKLCRAAAGLILLNSSWGCF